MEIKEVALKNQSTAWKIIKESRIVELWKEIGARVNLVGSLKSGLLMKNRDIDFHIYTKDLDISRDFSVMAKLAENPAIKDIQYRNLINTEEECIEWHAWYKDVENNLWQMDLIHIREGSTYDGLVERITDTIIKCLTPELTEAILNIKYNVPDNTKIPGIDIYRAVISDGIRNYQDFTEWHKANVGINSLEWLPKQNKC